MGYAILAVSLLAGVTKGYCGKKMGSFAENTTSAVLLNLVRMLLCVAFGALLLVLSRDADSLTFEPKILAISALSGISTSVFVITWILAVRKSAYMMLDVFLMLGTLVPMLCGYVAFGEAVSAKQWLGFLVLVAAVVIMCSYNNAIKTKLTASSLVLLAVCGLSNGITDFLQKTFVRTVADAPLLIFNLYTYFFAAVTLGVIYPFAAAKQKPQFGEGVRGKYVYVFVMSATLLIHSYFKTMAASYLDSAQLYPLSQGCSLILSALMAAVMFKEKLTLRGILGIVTAFVGLLIMNFL